MKNGESVMATMLREGCGREQFIPVELQEHFDMLNADLRMENENKIKVHYNVQDMETKFHCDLREHMDVLKVKIEMPDTKKYMEKIKWSQMEVQKKLLSVKSGKQPGTDKIRGEINKWMASSEVCMEIKMAMNKVMEERNVLKGGKTSRTVMVQKTKKPEPKDHGPTALTNAGYKIFMSLAKDKIVEHIRQVEKTSKF